MSEFLSNWRRISEKDRELASPAKNSHTGGPKSHRLMFAGALLGLWGSGGDGPVISEAAMKWGVAVAGLSAAVNGHTVAFHLLRKSVRIARDTSLIAKDMFSKFVAGKKNLEKRNDETLRKAKLMADSNKRIERINESKGIVEQQTDVSDKATVSQAINNKNNSLTIERPFDNFMNKYYSSLAKGRK